MLAAHQRGSFACRAGAGAGKVPPVGAGTSGESRASLSQRLSPRGSLGQMAPSHISLVNLPRNRVTLHDCVRAYRVGLRLHLTQTFTLATKKTLLSVYQLGGEY